jgi:hypothetical protein
MDTIRKMLNRLIIKVGLLLILGFPLWLFGVYLLLLRRPGDLRVVGVGLMMLVATALSLTLWRDA